MKEFRKGKIMIPMILALCLLLSLTVYAAMGGRAKQVQNHFAVKKCRDYRIRYDSNREKYGLNFLGDMEDDIVPYDETVCLRMNGFSFPGARFVCWTKESDPKGDVVSFLDGQEVCNLASPEETEVTLYAQWESAPSPLEQGYYKVILQGGKGREGAFYHKDEEESRFVDEKFSGYGGESFSGLIYAEEGTVVTLSEEAGEPGASYRCIGTREEDGSIGTQEWFE